jgi:hypothetical protein
MKNEIWKAVVGYEGLYEVSNLGNVRSLNFNRTGKIQNLILHKLRKDYFNVTLSFKNTTTAFSVHRIVAIAFIPNPENKRTVNHKNGIPSDNSVENLEWMTYGENIKHAYDYLGKKPNKTGLGKLGKLNGNSKPINQFSLDGIFIRYWDSASQIKIELKFSTGDISSCCTGKHKTCGGFKWEFA